MNVDEDAGKEVAYREFGYRSWSNFPGGLVVSCRNNLEGLVCQEKQGKFKFETISSFDVREYLEVKCR